MKNKKRVKIWCGFLIFVGILFLGIGIIEWRSFHFSRHFSNSNFTISGLYLPQIKDQQNENSNTNIPEDNTNLNTNKTVEQYLQESAEAYQKGDKERALQAVEEGLKIEPDNELLKSRRDLLLKDYLPSGEEDMPRQ